MRLLSDLLANAQLEAHIVGDASVAITAITADSRQVTPGSLFVAMPGVRADGAQYIADAIARGAAAVICAEGAAGDSSSTTFLYVTDMRASVSALAAAFYPRQPEYCVAITGTDGKTSTADFVRQLANLSGLDAASIGTLGLRSRHTALDAAFPAINTSPEPILLHHTLQQLADAGVKIAAIETSSHGLDQKRADGVRFAAAAFTNLTRDHLDYHGTTDAYFAAKSLLFSRLLRAGSVAVINHDDAHFAALQQICVHRSIHVVSFGFDAAATYRILRLTPHAGGLEAVVVIHGVEHTLSLPLYGSFQLSNMLAAVGLLEGASLRTLDAMQLLAYLPKLQGVPGRLEKIGSYHNAPIFIDYAHTPAALGNILKTLRPHTTNKLHVVFGCGGDRDAGKRPEMGAVAAQHADRVIITDDNPRSEDPAAIRAAILAAAPGAFEVADRATAIRRAIHHLEAGDVLVVAGKGHETTQIIGNQTLPFNDAEEIRKVIAA